MLSGVRYFEYLVSLIIVSLFFSLFIITIIPLILNSKVSILNFNYFLVLFYGHLCMFNLLNRRFIS